MVKHTDVEIDGVVAEKSGGEWHTAGSRRRQRSGQKLNKGQGRNRTSNSSRFTPERTLEGVQVGDNIEAIIYWPGRFEFQSPDGSIVRKNCEFERNPDEYRFCGSVLSIDLNTGGFVVLRQRRFAETTTLGATEYADDIHLIPTRRVRQNRPQTERELCAATEMPLLDLRELAALQQSVNESSLDASKGRKGHFLFIDLQKRFSNVFWVGDSIVVSDRVIIAPPFTSNCVSLMSSSEAKNDSISVATRSLLSEVQAFVASNIPPVSKHRKAKTVSPKREKEGEIVAEADLREAERSCGSVSDNASKTASTTQ